MKIKCFQLTNPVGLESMVVLMFFTPSVSKPHPPHWTVKSDSNSKTVRGMSKKERDRTHSDNCWKLSVVLLLVQTEKPTEAHYIISCLNYLFCVQKTT